MQCHTIKIVQKLDMAQLVTTDGGIYKVDIDLLVDALGNVDNITFPVTVTVKLSASGKIMSL